MRNVGGNAAFETVNCEATGWLFSRGPSASTFSPPSSANSDTGVQNTLKPNLFFPFAAEVSELKPLILRILK